MKKFGNFIVSLVLIILLLGGIAIGAAMLTGADVSRILNVLESNYQITETFNYWYNYGLEQAQQVINSVISYLPL